MKAHKLSLLLVLAACQQRQQLSLADSDLFDSAITTTLTSFVDVGTKQGREHLISGWHTDEVWKGFEAGKDTTITWGIGKHSVLSFAALGSQPLTMSLRCMAFPFPNAPSQTLTVEINNNALGAFPVLSSGLTTIDVPIPATALLPGENVVVFSYGWAKSPRDVTWPKGDARRADRRTAKLAVAFDSITFDQEAPSEIARREGKNLIIPAGAMITFYDRWSDLRLEVDGISPWKSPTAQLRIVARSDKRGVFFDEWLQVLNYPRTIKMPTVATEPTAVIIQVMAAGEANAAGVVLHRPKFSVPIEKDKTSKKTQTTRPTTARPNLVFYLIDTTRADHLSPYGYQRPTTPNLGSFAKTATVFENMVASAPWTRPSVASLMTGLSPFTHQANDADEILSDDVDTLAELLQTQGYETAGFVSNSQVTASSGFAQGFDTFQYLSWEKPEGQAANMNARVAKWLAQRSKTKPFFLYVHTMDPHSPYAPPAKQRKAFAPDADLELGQSQALEALQKERWDVTTKIVRDMANLYDAEIAANDEAFGRFVSLLQEEGLYETSHVVVLSDHGEEFYEHGSFEHMKTVYREVLSVPLLIKWAHSEGPQKFTPLFQHDDVLPTMLQSLGMTPPAGIDGRALWANITNNTQPLVRPTYSLLRHKGIHAQAVRDDGFKLVIHKVRDRYETRREMYEKTQDLEEHHNIIGRFPVRARFMEAELKRYARTRKALSPTKVTLTKDDERALRALGYMH